MVGKEEGGKGGWWKRRKVGKEERGMEGLWERRKVGSKVRKGERREGNDEGWKEGVCM